jgi:hypothetical protein
MCPVFMAALDRNDASLRPDFPAFERLGALKPRTGHKILYKMATSSKNWARIPATWGMSVTTHSKKDASCLKQLSITPQHWCLR